MQGPDTDDKYRSLKRGDPVQILRGGDLTSVGDRKGDWFDATVVSNSDGAVAAKFSDDGLEVVPWTSGRNLQCRK